MNTAPHLAAAAAAHAAGRWGEAEAHYRRALQISPSDPGILRAASIANYQLGRVPAARQLIEKSIRIAPRAETLLILAGLAAAAGDRPAAIRACERALALSPGDPGALLELAMLQMQDGAFDAAEPNLRELLRSQPDQVQAVVNLADVLARRDAFDEAEAMLRAILARTRAGAFGRPHALLNLAAVLRKRQQYTEARNAYQAAIQEAPDFAEAHRDLGLLLLMLGEAKSGFAEYSWRWKAAQRGAAPLSGPCWNGAVERGRTLLLHWEQGLGDTLQFLRYVPAAMGRAGKVILAVQKPLAALTRASLPGVEVVSGAKLPRHDAHAYLLDLPLLLGLETQCQPMTVPYVQPPSDRLAFWQRAMPAGGLRVGIAWAGNPAHENDRSRSLLPSMVEQLTAIDGVRLFSLQPGVEPPSGVLRLPAAHGDFADSAGAVLALDLVISVDTAAAHLAGALGREVWLLIPAVADWRWGTQGETTSWYPDMRVFRQTQPGDWDGVIARVAAALRSRAIELASEG